MRALLRSGRVEFRVAGVQTLDSAILILDRASNVRGVALELNESFPDQVESRHSCGQDEIQIGNDRSQAEDFFDASLLRPVSL
jgi:hypothetical protein